MSYPLRLPPNLDAAARERAAAIGISFNSFLCVCVDAYVNGAGQAVIQASVPRAASQSEQRQDKRNEAEFQAIAGELDKNSQPIDDEPDAIVGEYGEGNPIAMKALEDEYWATRERPANDLPSAQARVAPPQGRSKRRRRKR